MERVCGTYAGFGGAELIGAVGAVGAAAAGALDVVSAAHADLIRAVNDTPFMRTHPSWSETDAVGHSDDVRLGRLHSRHRSFRHVMCFRSRA